jgi:hypothetical protein
VDELILVDSHIFILLDDWSAIAALVRTAIYLKNCGRLMGEQPKNGRVSEVGESRHKQNWALPSPFFLFQPSPPMLTSNFRFAARCGTGLCALR